MGSQIREIVTGIGEETISGSVRAAYDCMIPYSNAFVPNIVSALTIHDIVPLRNHVDAIVFFWYRKSVRSTHPEVSRVTEISPEPTPQGLSQSWRNDTPVLWFNMACYRDTEAAASILGMLDGCVGGVMSDSSPEPAPRNNCRLLVSGVMHAEPKGMAQRVAHILTNILLRRVYPLGAE